METDERALLLLPLASIRVGPRRRPVDAKVVHDIAQSIERQGLFQPIGVKPGEEEDEWALVFGAHRYAAYELLQREMIEATALPDGLSAEAYLLIELQENSARNDLTGAQRKAYAGEIGQLFARIQENETLLNEQKNWLAHFSKTSNIPFATMRSWWTARAWRGVRSRPVSAQKACHHA